MPGETKMMTEIVSWRPDKNEMWRQSASLMFFSVCGKAEFGSGHPGLFARLNERPLLVKSEPAMLRFALTR